MGPVLLALAALVLNLSPTETVSLTQFELPLVAAILTAESVILALSFDSTNSWPSFSDVARYIYFVQWLAIAMTATFALVASIFLDNRYLRSWGSLVLAFAILFGAASLLRLLRVTGSLGRREFLRDSFRNRIAESVRHNPETWLVSRNDAAELADYIHAVSRSIDSGDSVALTAQLDCLLILDPRREFAMTWLELHRYILERLIHAAIFRDFPPDAAGRLAKTLYDSILDRVALLASQAPNSAEIRDDIGNVTSALLLGIVGRLAAWILSSIYYYCARGDHNSLQFRSFAIASLRTRDRVVRMVDPDQPSSTSVSDLKSILSSPFEVLVWLRCYVELHGSNQAAALYPTYELLTGEKYLRNYWDGASVVSDLRRRLWSTDSNDNAILKETRELFGDQDGFDLFWTSLGVGALATLRDATLTFPIGLIHSEFSPDRRLLSAYVRTYATHRFVRTAEEARSLLNELVMDGGPGNHLWWRCGEIIKAASSFVWPPILEPSDRPAACVLTVACKLVPESENSETFELRRFLEWLPDPMLEATQREATRVFGIPHVEQLASGYIEDLIDRLSIVTTLLTQN